MCGGNGLNFGSGKAFTAQNPFAMAGGLLQRWPGFQQFQQFAQQHPDAIARMPFVGQAFANAQPTVGQGIAPAMATGGPVRTGTVKRRGNGGPVRTGKITLTKEERDFCRAQGLNEIAYARNKLRMLEMRGE